MSTKRKLKVQAFLISLFLLLILLISLIIKSDNETNRKNIEFITSYGWQVEERPIDISYITIPKDFDKVTEVYNNTVASDGFNIETIKGKTVMRYSYKVTNHRDSNVAEIRINIFVNDGEIVSADISSLSDNGFVLPISHTLSII